MLSNLQISGRKIFRRKPTLDKATGRVQFGSEMKFLNSVVSKLE